MDADDRIVILEPSWSINGSRNQVSQGNSDLISTRSNNLDILGEHYFNTAGAVQAGFFFKQLSNPIVTTQHTIPAGQPNASFVDVQPINLPGDHIGGGELSWEQHLKSRERSVDLILVFGGLCGIFV